MSDTGLFIILKKTKIEVAENEKTPESLLNGIETRELIEYSWESVQWRAVTMKNDNTCSSVTLNKTKQQNIKL